MLEFSLIHLIIFIVIVIFTFISVKTLLLIKSLQHQMAEHKAELHKLVQSKSSAPIMEDRNHLLLLMARSFNAVSKLVVEKRVPESDQVILVFQMKNGNLRFSIPEYFIPEWIRPKTTNINKDRINFKNNYRLIRELIDEDNKES